MILTKFPGDDWVAGADAGSMTGLAVEYDLWDEAESISSTSEPPPLSLLVFSTPPSEDVEPTRTALQTKTIESDVLHVENILD